MWSVGLGFGGSHVTPIGAPSDDYSEILAKVTHLNETTVNAGGGRYRVIELPSSTIGSCAWFWPKRLLVRLQRGQPRGERSAGRESS